MCGIVGIIGVVGVRDEARFKHMLIVDQLRGQDSVGVFGVEYNGDVSVAKSIENPVAFLKEDTTLKLFRNNNRVLIGHNRAATQGSIKVENAHPFIFGHITGVHNGTVYNHGDIGEKNDFDVDSKAIYSSISKFGIVETWKHLFGAAALVWWDAKEHRVCILRNKERPLHYAAYQDKLYIMSERGMLDMMLERECREYDTVWAFTEEFKPGILYKINPKKPSTTTKHVGKDGKTYNRHHLNAEEVTMPERTFRTVTVSRQTVTPAPYVSVTSMRSISGFTLRKNEPTPVIFHSIEQQGGMYKRILFQPVDVSGNLATDAVLSTFQNMNSVGEKFLDILYTELALPPEKRVVFRLSPCSLYSSHTPIKNCVMGGLNTDEVVPAILGGYEVGEELGKLYPQELRTQYVQCQNCLSTVAIGDSVTINDSVVCQACANQLTMYG